MDIMFSGILDRIEKFLKSGNDYLTSNEKALMKTVLTDVKVSICSGRLDRYVGRQHPFQCELFYFKFYSLRLTYFKKNGSGYLVKALKYSADTIDLERLKKELEHMGFEVEMSKVKENGIIQNPIHVYLRIPAKKRGT